MNLFAEKTGKFIGLTDEQIGTLNAQQHDAYDRLAAAAADLDKASAGADAASADCQQAVRAVADAEAAERTAPKPWTAHDEWLASVGRGHQAPKPDDALALARTTLVESQTKLRTANARQADCRARVARCITDWQMASGAVQTFDGLVKQHIDNSNRERAERVASGRPAPSPTRPGKSAIDQFAYYTKQSGRRAGGGSSFRRGGMTLSEAARVGFRAKLPSER